MGWLCGGAALCAAATAESNDFSKAAKKFQAGFWDFAASDFAAFVTNYPSSPRVPEAILYQAEAAVTAGQFNEAIKLLAANQGRSGQWEDSYLYWTARAHLGNKNFSAAAEAFHQLVERFPSSSVRLESCVGEATACARLTNWPRVIAVLGQTNGVFQRYTGTVTNDWISQGYLLLGEAQLAVKNFEAAGAAAQRLGTLNLKPEASWRRWYLQCRIDLGDGKIETALSNTTNLFPLAASAGSKQLQAESYALQAGILEQAKRYDEALTVYQNLTTNAPVDQQRSALLKIAEICLAQNKTADAVHFLENFWNQHPRSAASDIVLLSLGELQLKQAVGAGQVSTNLIEQAAARFDALLESFPDSLLIGKALLGKGWCQWYSQQFSASAESFRRAAERLPVSEDQAIARFKQADAQYMAGNFAPAVATYRLLANSYDSVPVIKEKYLERALYQTVRAAIAATNLPVAQDAMRDVLKWYPNGLAGDHCLFLVGDSYSRTDPAKARQLLGDFETQFPDSVLLPQVGLALARTYEKEGNWAAAVTNYDSWIGTFTNHTELPNVQFARAWDTYKAGFETNALGMFTNFVAKFPTNELAPRAQWWVGNFYFQRGDFKNAEDQYQFQTNWSSSELFLPARMMAGRAAMKRFDYKGAIWYFTNLVNDPTSPVDLKIQAAMAAGDAFMARTEPGATNRLVDLQEAATYFNSIPKFFPTNAQVPIACGRLGDCYKELGASDPRFYDKAADEYRKAINSSIASIATQRQAMIGLGILAEKQSEGKTGEEQKRLLTEGLGHYLEAFTFRRELRPGEQNDWFWFQKAGLESARLAEALGMWDQAIRLYKQMRDLPDLSTQFQANLDKKILKATENKGAAGVREN
ncbi:MAG: tetratricopeptide repeat protein [Verrucomicrobiota bacterium]